MIRCLLIIAVSGIAISACAPKYQSFRPFEGGFEESQISKSRYQIRYYGDYMYRGEIQKLWHRRAAELCGGDEKYTVESYEHFPHSPAQGSILCK